MTKALALTIMALVGLASLAALGWLAVSLVLAWREFPIVRVAVAIALIGVVLFIISEQFLEIDVQAEERRAQERKP